MRANHEQNPYFVDLLQKFPTSAMHFVNDLKNGQDHFTIDSKFTLVDINGTNFKFEFNAASRKLTIISDQRNWPDVKDLKFQQTPSLRKLHPENFVLTWDNNEQKHCFNQYKIVNGQQVDQFSQYRQDRLGRLYESSYDKWTMPRK